MYVIEGSTLGGNVIAKQLSKTEGFDEVTLIFSDVIRRIQDLCGRILKRFWILKCLKKTMMRCFPERKSYIRFY
jgi:hypothetical protein